MDNTTALLVIDMQEGLLKKVKHNRYILINHVNRLIDYFHQKNYPVYFVQHSNRLTLRTYTNAWRISEQLHQLTHDKIFWKKSSSIFRNKNFMKSLEEDKIHTLIVVGLASNACVKAACIDGIAKGLTVTVIADAHSNFKKDTEQVIANWNEQFEYEGARIIKVEDFLKNEIECSRVIENEDIMDKTEDAITQKRLKEKIIVDNKIENLGNEVIKVKDDESFKLLENEGVMKHQNESLKDNENEGVKTQKIESLNELGSKDTKFSDNQKPTDKENEDIIENQRIKENDEINQNDEIKENDEVNENNN